MKSQGAAIFYGLIFAGLIGTGAMILGWYLTPPNPDRVGYWYIVLLLGLPYLAGIGLLALALRRTLALPRRLGVSLIAYPVMSFTLMALATVRSLAPILDPLLFSFLGGFEGLQVLLWTLTFVSVLSSLLPGRGRLLLKVFVGVLLVACGVVLASTHRQSYDLSRRIDDLVLRATAQGGVADFAQLDVFTWDRMYVFRPFTPHSTVHAALGFTWDSVDAVDIRRREDINVVVFTRDRSVVAYLALPRSRLDFARISDFQRFAPSSARFHTRVASGSQIVMLTPLAP